MVAREAIDDVSAGDGRIDRRIACGGGHAGIGSHGGQVGLEFGERVALVVGASRVLGTPELVETFLLVEAQRDVVIVVEVQVVVHAVSVTTAPVLLGGGKTGGPVARVAKQRLAALGRAGSARGRDRVERPPRFAGRPAGCR